MKVMPPVHFHGNYKTLQGTLAQSTGAAEYTDCICAEVLPLCNEHPRYDTKQSDGEASVMLEHWGMQSTPLLSSLSGPL